jgi:hypothetical protein
MWGAVAGAALGLVQTGISAAKASQLPDDKQYSVSPELRAAYNMSRRRADEGYSPEEKAAFEQMLARQGTAAKRMFQNVGLAGAGSAAANIMGIDALNQFAANGASIKRQNAGDFYGLAGQMQGVQDQETTRFNNQLNIERQALGEGVQAGISNIQGGFQGIETSMNQQKAMDLYKNYGMDSTTDTTNPNGLMSLSGLFGNNPQAPQKNNYGFTPNFKPNQTFSSLYGGQPQQPQYSILQGYSPNTFSTFWGQGN